MPQEYRPVVAFRLPKRDLKALQRLAKSRGTGVASIVREGYRRILLEVGLLPDRETVGLR